MTEHTHTGKVNGDALSRFVHLPRKWPVGAEVTVTWTEPDPEPTGRWVVDENIAGLRRPYWDDSTGDHWSLRRLVRDDESPKDEAEAALVDLIESDLPPQMPNVDDIFNWVSRNTPSVAHPTDHTYRTIIRGTLDAIAALPAPARGPE